MCMHARRIHYHVCIIEATYIVGQKKNEFIINYKCFKNTDHQSQSCHTLNCFLFSHSRETLITGGGRGFHFLFVYVCFRFLYFTLTSLRLYLQCTVYFMFTLQNGWFKLVNVCVLLHILFCFENTLSHFRYTIYKLLTVTIMLDGMVPEFIPFNLSPLKSILPLPALTPTL